MAKENIFHNYISQSSSYFNINGVSLKKEKSFKSINEVTDNLLRENIEVSKIRQLALPYNSIQSIDNIEKFESLTELDLRFNQISDISNTTIDFIQNRIYQTKSHSDSYILDGLIDKHADDLSNYNFILLLSDNKLSDTLLKKLNLESIPQNFKNLHEPYWVEDLTFLLKNTIRLYNASEHSQKFQKIYSTVQFFFNDVCLNFNKYPEFGWHQTVSYFLETPRNDKMKFITDLNPYVSNLARFETGNSYVKEGSLVSERNINYHFKIYYKEIEYPNHLLYLEDLETKFGLNLDIIRAKFRGEKLVLSKKKKWWQL